MSAIMGRTRLNEPGPCGRKLSIQIDPEVEIAYVTIPRRAHMRRRSSVDGREGNGRSTGQSPKEVSDREKWHNSCIAIRDAGNLAIELGSQRLSTNAIIPKYNRKTGRRENIKPCIKMSPIQWDSTPISGPDCQLRSPVLWCSGTDTVLHYPCNPWAMNEALGMRNAME